MAFKMKGYSAFTKETNNPDEVAHNRAEELKILENNLSKYQEQYENNPNKNTKKDLDWARQALDEFHGGA